MSQHPDCKVSAAARKPPLDLLPMRALYGAARAFQYGATKYAPGNYLNASLGDGAVNRYVGATLRHLTAMQCLDGQYGLVGSLDAESGLPHLDHAIASLLMLRAIAIFGGHLSADPVPEETGR